MDISGLLTDDHSFPSRRTQSSAQGGFNHPHAAHHTLASYNDTNTVEQSGHAMTPLTVNGRTSAGATSSGSTSASASPTKGAKRVKFELLLPTTNSPRRQTPARLPMSVNIWPHDPTASIIATVKNFFGLYEGQCVSFEDKDGNTLIAHHDNFYSNMTVYIRASQGEDDSDEAQTPNTMSPKRPRLGPPIQMDMLPPQVPHAHNITRPSSRTGIKRSVSPQPARSHRGTSVGSTGRARSRPSAKGRVNSAHGSITDFNMEYTQDDSDNASVTSSRRGKGEILASAEISVENIVEGGRRKRAKFDSSELPLFVPSQMPVNTSVSSVSPQRRIGSGSMASPYTYNNAQTFAYPMPLPSPHSHNQNDMAYTNGFGSAHKPGSGRYGGRYGTRQAPARHSVGGSGVLPTPDPTIGGSVISDEDVALQLMRLGEASNFSTHGRTSTSTINEDAHSGKAEAASYSGDSVGASDGEDNVMPRRGGDYSSGEDFEDDRDGSFKGYSDEIMPQAIEGAQKQKVSMAGSSKSASKGVGKTGKSRLLGMPKSKKLAPNGSGSGKMLPMSPSSLHSQSRKASNGSLNFQHQFGADEEDLSSKPRCQRCRKSKKGCDRQRPCGRCKDAGIGIEGCISEDEGNGRKGRYGRHMGVPVKKSLTDAVGAAFVEHSHPHPHAHGHAQSNGHGTMATVQSAPMLAATPSAGSEASKKRKR